MICGLPMLVLMSVSFDRRSVLCETFSWPGLEAGESRLVFRSYFLGACLRSGDGRQRSSFEGFFVAELASSEPGWFLIRIYRRALCGLYKACCPSRRVLRGLFYVERLGFDPVVCGVPGSTRRP